MDFNHALVVIMSITFLLIGIVVGQLTYVTFPIVGF